MLAHNPLTESFVRDHPVDAARVLERLPAEQVVSYLHTLDENQASQLFHYFMPNFAGHCLLHMSDRLLNDCAEHVIADVCRALLGMDKAQQQGTLGRLQAGLARQVRARLRYPVDSVARYFTQSCPILTANMLAGDALRHLEDMQYRDGCMLYVVDDDHKLKGSIDISRLLTADRKETLVRLLPRQNPPQILISARLNDVEQHPGWLNHRQLPVVDRNGTYMGELEYETVSNFSQQLQLTHQSTEAFGSLLSLAGVYWLSVSWLVDCLFGKSTDTDNPEARHER